MSPTSFEVPYGTLDLMVLKTLDTMGPLHGYGIARRIEQIAQGSLALNQGTIYPALLRLEQKGWIKSEWGTSENNRRARFYCDHPRRPQAAAERDRQLGANGRDDEPAARGPAVIGGDRNGLPDRLPDQRVRERHTGEGVERLARHRPPGNENEHPLSLPKVA